jgi:hypothetical protein
MLLILRHGSDLWQWRQQHVAYRAFRRSIALHISLHQTRTGRDSQDVAMPRLQVPEIHVKPGIEFTRACRAMSQIHLSS